MLARCTLTFTFALLNTVMCLINSCFSSLFNLKPVIDLKMCNLGYTTVKLAYTWQYEASCLWAKHLVISRTTLCNSFNLGIHKEALVKQVGYPTTLGQVFQHEQLYLPLL